MPWQVSRIGPLAKGSEKCQSCCNIFPMLFYIVFQLFEDSIELQTFYIKTRDELCKNGESLLSPALSYTEHHMNSAVEKMKKTKLVEEAEEAKKLEENEMKIEAKDIPKAAEVGQGSYREFE